MNKSGNRKLWIGVLVVVLALAVTWQVALAAAPMPNPLATNPGANLSATGPAATMHGSPLAGRALFSANCETCHGDRGTGSVDNVGSDDGTVPAVNPIDPGFAEDAPGDPANFARNIDLFIQHGSRPSGEDPEKVMPAWGDKKLLTQAQIADVEAYVMQLNNIYWPDRWYPPAEVQMDAKRAGNVVVYTINVLNQGGASLDGVQLRDTLPAGLSFVYSDYYGRGNNPAQVVGSTVQWLVDSIPPGGSAGPFIIVAGVAGNTVPANVSQVLFNYTNSDGDVVPASQVSDPVVPK